jgi:hypothetical protein
MKSVLVNLSVVAGLTFSFAAGGCGSNMAGPDGGSGGSTGNGGSTGSGGSGATACGVAPCGGNVVGSWRASSACVDSATLNMEFLAGVMGSCPTASLGNVHMVPTGTVALASDMTFTGAVAVSSMMDLTFPATCIGGATCPQLTEALQSLVGSNGVTSVSCAGSGACTCTMVQGFDVVSGTGTWVSSGTTLTFSGAAGDNGGPYCVQGTSLHLIDVDMTTMMKVVGDIVLTRE